MELLIKTLLCFGALMIVLVLTYCIGRMAGAGFAKSLEDIFTRRLEDNSLRQKEKETP